MDYLKPIHLTKLWRGAVFALTSYGSPVVWYHCDFISSTVVGFTAMHSGKTYTKGVYDRFVWLRSSKP